MLRRKRPRTRFKAVDGIVAAILRDTHGETRRRRPSISLKVCNAFDALGPPLTLHAEPSQFRRGVLTLVVDDTAWLTELTFLAPDIIARLNAQLGTESVKELRARHGKLTYKAKKQEPAPPENPPAISEHEAVWLAQIAEPLHSPSLKEVFVRAAKWALRRRS